MQAPPLRLYPHSRAKLQINFQTDKEIDNIFQKISFSHFISHLSHDSSGSLATWALEHGRDYFYLSQISPVISPYNLKCRV